MKTRTTEKSPAPADALVSATKEIMPQLPDFFFFWVEILRLRREQQQRIKVTVTCSQRYMRSSNDTVSILV
jgi:hypothetical protein